jgi:uncharacterized protein (DUF362 family)/NAD-dependent dihydropyrimidine dehydrogenase PreA subunit
VSFVVGIAECPDYERGRVARALSAAVGRAGGMPSLAGEALVKANLLSPSAPERAVTTHPEVIRAIIGEIRRQGDFPIHVADNPGYVFTDARRLFEATGVDGVGDIGGVTFGLLSDRGFREVGGESFRELQRARISSRYLDSSFCVNAAKLKTHVETEISGCLKNIFGAADTETRKRCHNSTSQTRLAESIVDIFAARPPEFNIMDAIVGMEGDGPSHGRPRGVGYILASRGAAALDWVAAAIMGYGNPLEIPILAAAARRGVGPAQKGEIALVGAKWRDLPLRGFKKSSGAIRALPTLLRGFAHKLVLISPKLDRQRCLRCGICGQVCPVGAITDGPGSGSGKGFPAIDRRKCVRCLCCHEMCPTGAMAARGNLLARLAAGAGF